MADRLPISELAFPEIADEGVQVAVADMDVPTDEDDVLERDGGSAGDVRLRSVQHDRLPNACAPGVQPRPVAPVVRSEPGNRCRSARFGGRGQHRRWL